MTLEFPGESRAKKRKWIFTLLLLAFLIITPFLSLEWFAVEYADYSPHRIWGTIVATAIVLIAVLYFGYGQMMKAWQFWAGVIVIFVPLIFLFFSHITGFYASNINCLFRIGTPTTFSGTVTSKIERTHYLNKGISRFVSHYFQTHDTQNTMRELVFDVPQSAFEQASNGDVYKTQIQRGILGYYCEFRASGALEKAGASASSE